MAGRMWSIWDEIRIDDRSIMMEQVAVPTPLAALRARRRFAVMEELVEVVAVGTGGEFVRDRARAAEQELRDRMVCWGVGEEPATQANEGEPTDLIWPAIMQLGPDVPMGPVVRPNDSALKSWARLGLLAMSLYGSCLVYSSRWAGLWVLGVLVVFVVIGALWRGFGWRGRAGRAAASVRRKECPDCGYDLSGAQVGVAAEIVGGLWVGPRRCPECGAPWPMVPPPVPKRAAHG